MEPHPWRPLLFPWRDIRKRLLGLSEARVRRAAPSYARKLGRNWWREEEAIAALRSRMGKAGRPPKKTET